MTHQEKIDWMIKWAHEQKVMLDLNGECGFGRECVGITAAGSFPSYQWFDDEYERIDNNGDVWIPEDAYHKHECVAVLGRGPDAEAQLYDWLKWFDDNGFAVEVTAADTSGMHPIELMMGRANDVRIVKQ